jgi:galactose mutarotase-like enzyme
MDDVALVKVIPLDTVTLPFFGSVDANSIKTLVSSALTFPFTTESFRVHFALNTNKLLRVRFFISPDDSEPTSFPVTGHSIFEPSGQVDYLVGDDETVEVRYRVAMNESGMFIKVIAENLDSYEHSIDAHVEISRKV